MGMQQPELGRRLTALRKEKNLTQEELVAKSHVSVRTIQRIEAGEVLPRTITVKILLEALGETYESFSAKQNLVVETSKGILPTTHRNTLLIAALAGAVYLISEVILGAMDVAWFVGNRDWGFRMNVIYTGLIVVMVISLAMFARGFIVLGAVFENSLLRVASCLLINDWQGHFGCEFSFGGRRGEPLDSVCSDCCNNGCSGHSIRRITPPAARQYG
jgi:transcriptional regulator with XRE-family HTH domain